MQTLNTRMKALFIAGFISGLLIIAIANLSYVTQQKSVLIFDQPATSCISSVCSVI